MFNKVSITFFACLVSGYIYWHIEVRPVNECRKTYSILISLQKEQLQNIDQEFSKNIETNDYRALCILGVGRSVPGLSNEEAGEHEKKYGVKIIGGTDNGRCLEVFEYQELLTSYAKTYNIKLVNYLIKKPYKVPN